MNKKGFFITIEGPEGAGKSTQCKMLCGYLEALGFECVWTREPGGTPVAEKLRDIVKYSKENISEEAELLLFNAARALHVANLIRPAVERGAIVICDRFADSTTAYQGYGRELNLEEVKNINSYAVGNCVPDLTLVLDLDQKSGFGRVKKRNHASIADDRFENAGSSFHDKVRDGFLKIAELEPERVKIIEASGSPECVHVLIREKVDDLIK